MATKARRLTSWLRAGLWATGIGCIVVFFLWILCYFLSALCAPIYSVLEYVHRPIIFLAQAATQWLGTQLGVKEIGADAWVYPEGTGTILRIVEVVFYLLYWFLLGVIGERMYMFTLKNKDN